MLEGALRIGSDGEMQLVDGEGVVLAVGGLSAHPGSQMISRDDFVSGVQFTGKLTEAGQRVIG